MLFGAGSVIRNAPRGVAISASVALIASLVLALLAFANRRYEEAPKPEAVIRLMAADEAWLRWRFLGNLTKALDTNRTKLSGKRPSSRAPWRASL